jgi:flavin reductase (DIM6/NTAB) family NADH-FMN oxidoreductase RutF
MRNLPLLKVYQLLEPGPAVLLTTAHKGRVNIMTMSWQMMVEFHLPVCSQVLRPAQFVAKLRISPETVPDAVLATAWK